MPASIITFHDVEFPDSATLRLNFGFTLISIICIPTYSPDAYVSSHDFPLTGLGDGRIIIQ